MFPNKSALLPIAVTSKERSRIHDSVRLLWFVALSYSMRASSPAIASLTLMLTMEPATKAALALTSVLANAAIPLAVTGKSFAASIWSWLGIRSKNVLALAAKLVSVVVPSSCLPWTAPMSMSKNLFAPALPMVSKADLSIGLGVPAMMASTTSLKPPLIYPYTVTPNTMKSVAMVVAAWARCSGLPVYESANVAIPPVTAAFRPAS